MATMTLEQLAVARAPFLVWRTVGCRTDAVQVMRVQDGSTGQWHTVEILPSGEVICSCQGFRSHGRCTHIAALAVDYSSPAEGIRDLTRSAVQPTPVVRPRVSESEKARLWG